VRAHGLRFHALTRRRRWHGHARKVLQPATGPRDCHVSGRSGLPCALACRALRPVPPAPSSSHLYRRTLCSTCVPLERLFSTVVFPAGWTPLLTGIFSTAHCQCACDPAYGTCRTVGRLLCLLFWNGTRPRPPSPVPPTNLACRQRLQGTEKHPTSHRASASVAARRLLARLILHSGGMSYCCLRLGPRVVRAPRPAFPSRARFSFSRQSVAGPRRQPSLGVPPSSDK